MFELILQIITWLSIALIVYHHLLYPIILKWVVRESDISSTDKSQSGADYHDDTLPSITLLIPAYNEQRWISEKIYNCVALDYPQQKLNVIIACDGCTDDTVAIAEKIIQQPLFQTLNISLKVFQQNRGKIAVVNDLMNEIDTDLVALTDVSTLVSLDALLITAEQFKDKHVGVLNSHYCFLDDENLGESSYWKYQSQIKTAESKLGSTLGAHGAFYVIRTALFTPLAADTINDDFILPMDIVAQGFQAKQINELIAVELENSDSSMNWQRRLRIAAGNLQQVFWLKHMLLPKYKGVAFTFASCKALRVVMPILMIAALLGCLSLSTTHWVYAVLAFIQTLLYGLALVQICLIKSKHNRLLNMLGYLVSGHAAMLIGGMNYIFKNRKSAWKPVTK